MRGILGAALPVLLAVVSSSCSTETTIFLTVKSGLKVPSEMDSIRIRIDEDGRGLFDRQYVLQDQKALTLAIAPGRGAEYQIHINAAAIKNGAEIASGEAVAGFKRDKTVEVLIELGPPGSGDGGFDGGVGDGGCMSECETGGVTGCVSVQTYHRCADLDGDGCLEWGPETSCGDNAECRSDACGCLPGFGNCNDDFSDGCESEFVRDSAHCGNCETSCDPARMHAAGTFCNIGRCDFDKCAVEYSAAGIDRSEGCQSWDYFPISYRGADLSGVKLALDGEGLFMAATTRAFGAGDADIWLVQLAPNGGVERQRTFGGTGFEAHASIVSAGQGYLVAGYTDSLGSVVSGYNIWLAGLDVDAEPLWQKMLGGTKAEYADFIAPLSNGEYLLAGRTASFGAGGDDIWLLRFKGNGEMVWQKVYGDTGNEIPTAVIETQGGDLLVVGTTQPTGSGSKSGIIYRLRGDGAVVSGREYSDTASAFFKPVSITETGSGGYLVSGVVSSAESLQEIAILRLNGNLDIDWQYRLGGAQADIAAAAAPSGDGGAVVCGYTESAGSGKRDMYFVKIGGDGVVQWQETYGGVGDDTATSIVVSSDGYFVGGTTQSFGATGQTTDAIVLRVYADGSIPGGCGQGFLMPCDLAIGALSITAKAFIPKSSDTNVTPVDAPAMAKSSSATAEMRCGE